MLARQNLPESPLLSGGGGKSFWNGSWLAQWPSNGSWRSSEKNGPEEFGDEYAKKPPAIRFNSKVIHGLLLVVVVIAFTYKIILSLMPEAKTDRLFYVTDYVRNSFNSVWEYVSDSENRNRYTPLLCGITLTIFSWIMVYLDSNIPGIHPPLPFSPKSTYRYHHQKLNSIHLGYMTAITSGVVVFALMTYNC